MPQLSTLTTIVRGEWGKSLMRLGRLHKGQQPGPVRTPTARGLRGTRGTRGGSRPTAKPLSAEVGGGWVTRVAAYVKLHAQWPGYRNVCVCVCALTGRETSTQGR
jgi:hypothetical protein